MVFPIQTHLRQLHRLVIILSPDVQLGPLS